MSDFLIDYREQAKRNVSKAVDLIRYYEDIKVDIFEYEKFTIVLSRADNWNIWGPYKSIGGDVFVALSGRIALENKDWEEAKDCGGEGGLACKAIYRIYRSEGIDSLVKNLNGNYIVMLYDAIIQKFYIIVDRCGMFPCFKTGSNKSGFVFSSHPDVLASVLNISDLDTTSMAEFLMTGKVSFPYTYYEKIKSVDFGCVYKFDLKGGKAVYESKIKYFHFNYNIDPNDSEWDIAEDLAAAFRKAINKRTLSIFGQSAISLSGGLDSRTILCSIDNKDSIKTFCFFDNENYEYKISKAIARELGIDIVPLKRDFDYYGDTAEKGVKIYGGMGNIINNHFLGFRKRLKEVGFENIITGFYCDYFFKGLALDRRRNKILRREVLSKFNYQWYRPCFWFNTDYLVKVKDRLSEVFTESIRNNESEIGRLRIEEKRLFPLCYEPDNAETTIPQRVMGWYLPIVDNSILEVYLRTPPRYKMNNSMYSKMVELQCGKKISKIPNSNTGASVNASQLKVLLYTYNKAIKDRVDRKMHSIALAGSWPNWEYYMHNSKKVNSLWFKKSNSTKELFQQIVGYNPYEIDIEAFTGDKVDLFSRLLTLKLWFDKQD